MPQGFSDLRGREAAGISAGLPVNQTATPGGTRGTRSRERRTLGVYSRKRPLGPNGEKICYNCGGLLPKGRPFNCSAKCSEEWRCKTSPSHLRYVLHERDKGVCAICGIDTDALKKEYATFRDANKYGNFWNAKKDKWLNAHGIPWSRATGNLWDADHITPVIEGGGECGLDNFRTLCIPCHKQVTAELRGRMASKAQAQRLQDAQALLAAPLQFGTRPQVIKAARVLAKGKRRNPTARDPVPCEPSGLLTGAQGGQ